MEVLRFTVTEKTVGTIRQSIIDQLDVTIGPNRDGWLVDWDARPQSMTQGGDILLWEADVVAKNHPDVFPEMGTRIE